MTLAGRISVGAAAASFALPPMLWYGGLLSADGRFDLAASVALWLFPALWLEMLIWSVLRHGRRSLRLLALAPPALFWLGVFAVLILSCTHRNACL